VVSSIPQTRSGAHAIGLVALALGLLSPRWAAADEAAAESLFKAGTELVKAGDYAAACPKFAESQKQSPALGTLLALGDCYKRAGKTASALAALTNLAFAPPQ